MGKTIQFFTVYFAFCLIANLDASCQIAISDISQLPRIKTGTTYVAMNDPNSEIAKEYIQVFRANWTFSKIEFIQYSEIKNLIAPENSFLTISSLERSGFFINSQPPGSRMGDLSYSNSYVYLELWCYDKDLFLADTKEKSRNTFKNQIARIELYTDFKALHDPYLIIQSDYDGGGHIRNWGTGILKNYIQSLMTYLNKAEERSLYEGIFNQHEVKKLKNEVLYVPDYVLIKFNPKNGDESKTRKEEEIFGDYNLKYNLITTHELNNKINKEDELFYYVIYIKSSTEGYFSVINSQTGEIIYAKYSPMTYNFRPNDLTKLQAKILEE